MNQPITEAPILFSGSMVKAILEGRKTQTRRVIQPQPARFDCLQREFGMRVNAVRSVVAMTDDSGALSEACPYGKPGERLWVRETFLPVVGQNDKGEAGWFEWAPENKDDKDERPEEILYRATDDVYPKRWRPAIHMPRWASRIDLEVTKVRVERLQDITEADALAEGIKQQDRGASHWYAAKPQFFVSGEPTYHHSASLAFKALWNRINEARGFGWKKNPWVWVVSFKRVESNQ